ncbi:hypothetical protein [Nocardioides gilvus]|uniref:hypothetical protein n=1 Tax=Nocardioides gilvus TaxID=1735589 RepID=UPI0013A5B51D|nr:hypothetical protein [Nocardioides gilvus]
MLRPTRSVARLIVLTLAGTLLSVGLVAASAPTATANSGSISARPGVLYDTCRYHPYRYSFDVEPGYDDLSMDVEAYGPDGVVATSDFQYDMGTSGTGELQFCGSELSGRYELEAEVEACDDDFNCYSFTVSSSFKMRAPRTKTSLAVKPKKPRYNQVVKFVVRTRDERPAGYFSTDGAQVILQVRSKGTWTRVRASKTYAWDGKAVLRYRWDVRKPLKVRAKTLKSGTGTASASRPVTIRPK